MLDKLKLSISLLLLVGGIVAFYYFSDQSLLYRVLGLLAVVLIALGIAAQTDPGRSSLRFFKEARTEVRKVVWPDRRETTQTTLVVLVMVVLVGVMLWVMDMGLLWAVKFLTGQGS